MRRSFVSICSYHVFYQNGRALSQVHSFSSKFADSQAVRKHLFGYGPIRSLSSSSDVHLALQTLGLRPGCSKQEIKAKYYELAKKLHPDATGKQEQDSFVRLSDAFTIAYAADTGIGASQRMSDEAYEAYAKRKREAEEYVQKAANGVYEIEWEGETISNSGLDRGGHFWYMSMMQGMEAAETEAKTEAAKTEAKTKEKK